jgi:hypothetical protein
MSKEEEESTIPVTPPVVNKNKKPTTHNRGPVRKSGEPKRDATHLKILIPVGTAIIIVAAVK